MINILLVEKEPNIAHTLVRALQSELGRQADISACVTGEEALQILTEDSFDILISDYRLPNMTGAELIERSRTRNLKTILMTDIPLEYFGGHIPGSPDICLAKPFKIPALIAHLYEMLRH